jgi:hypothetical protein
VSWLVGSSSTPQVLDSTSCGSEFQIEVKIRCPIPKHKSKVRLKLLVAQVTLYQSTSLKFGSSCWSRGRCVRINAPLSFFYHEVLFWLGVYGCNVMIFFLLRINVYYVQMYQLVSINSYLAPTTYEM